MQSAYLWGGVYGVGWGGGRRGGGGVRCGGGGGGVYKESSGIRQGFTKHFCQYMAARLRYENYFTNASFTYISNSCFQDIDQVKLRRYMRNDKFLESKLE